MNWPEVVALGIGVAGFLGFMYLLTKYDPPLSVQEMRPRRTPRPSPVERLTDDFIERGKVRDEKLDLGVEKILDHLREQGFHNVTVTKVVRTYRHEAPQPKLDPEPLVTPPPADPKDQPN